MRLFTILLLSSGVLMATPVNAQDNPLGNLLGGILRGAIQESAKAKARTDWAAVNPKLADCLRTSLTNSPQQMAEQGISPSDPRLETYISRCNEQIAAEQQREKSAEAERIRREKGVEVERVRREETIKREADAREEAKRKADAAKLETQRKADQNEAKLKTDLTTLRNDSIVRSVLTGTATDVSLLVAAADSRNMTRGLDGTPTFRQQPDLCVVSSPLASNPDYSKYVKSIFEQKLGSPYRERACKLDERGHDVIALTIQQLETMPPSAQINILSAIKSRQFVPLATTTFEEFEAAGRQKRAAIATLESDIAAGKNVFALLFGAVPIHSICILRDDRQEALADLMKVRRSDWSDVLPSDAIPLRTHADANAAFVGLKQGDCGAVVLSAEPTAKVLDALKRDSFKAQLHPIALLGTEVDERTAKLNQAKIEDIQRKVEETRLREEAKAKADEERAAAEAERKRCISKAVATEYFAAACARAGIDSKSGINPAAIQKKLEEERAKLDSCPKDVLDGLLGAGRKASAQATSKVSPLVVFEEGVLSQCRAVAANILQ